ncbi:MAG: energy-coupling factor ABC transporter ATP-binding protein [Clostridia bacterium]|nr:energy-coupling factor ABC transporter ATP-binding protein [Clostridia bacterium]
MEILKVEDLSFCYPGEKEPVLKDISFSVAEGEFLCLSGATGCGKSTLLRLLKKELSPKGDRSGRILISGENIDDLDSAEKIGFVMQSPDEQIVTDTVWHELAFGLENIGMKREKIALRIAEIASYFGMSAWYDKKTSELSGGQKQMLNLAAVMAMSPDILILDEPTSQLDPIAASEFISTVKKLNRELSLTVIITEHRLEEVIPVSDRIMIMKDRGIAHLGSPRDIVSRVGDSPEILASMPSAAQLYHAVDGEGQCPLDVREGKRFIETGFRADHTALTSEKYTHSEEKALEFKQVFFRYAKETQDVLDSLSLTVYSGEAYFILGGNGSGKTTALGAASGLLKPYSGSIRVFEKKLKEYKNNSLYSGCLALLPQEVETLFLSNTVREELIDAYEEAKMLPIDVDTLLDKHPYDLSGGEKQLIALAKVLSQKPRILLLDEPTKGIDAVSKQRLAEVLRLLKKNGITVVAVTHDVDFAAMCADRCAMFFRGRVVAENTVREFFSDNSFYTTPINRMTRGYYSGAVTVSDCVELCRLNGVRDGAAV